MADSMRSVPWLKSELWANDVLCAGRVHLGVSNPEPQPMLDREAATKVWFDGEVYPSFAEKSVTPNVETITGWLDCSGHELKELDGVFGSVIFSQEKRLLTLINDRLGFRPIYFTETNHFFAYAAEVKALLAILDSLPELDDISLRQFFGFGHMLGERTWWSGIKLLPPASILQVSADRRVLKQYWSFDEIQLDPIPEEEAIIELGRLWTKSVRQRCKKGAMPLLLSGGLDSRLLLAELSSQGAEMVSVTWGSPDSADMKIARICAAVAAIPHREYHLDSGNWWNGRELAIWQTDGLVNGMHFHGAGALDLMHYGNMHTLINSTGDTLFGGSKLSKNGFKLRQRLRDMYIQNPFFKEEEVVDASINDCTRYLGGPSQDCFTISQRQRRLILMGLIYHLPYCEVTNPSVSLDLLKFVFGHVKDESRIDNRFYGRFLAERYSRYFTNIPWQKTGRGLRESCAVKLWRDVAGASIKASAAAIDLLSSTIPGVWRLAKNTHGSTGFLNYAACIEKCFVRDSLAAEDLLLDEYFSGRVRSKLNANGDERPGNETLLALLTAENYLRRVAGLPPVRLAGRL